jgi:hypothetical protein
MITGLFHYQVGFPKGLKTNLGTLQLKYTAHALKASKNDRYGDMTLPKKLNTATAKPIEVEIIRGMVTKMVYRADYNEELDIVIVVNRDCLVYTVWFNRKDDDHPTLDTTKYAKP